MPTSNRDAVIRFIGLIARPIAAISMRFGVSAQEACEIVRWSFVKAFHETPEFWRFDKATDIQCALKTGLPRVECKRLGELETVTASAKLGRQSRAARVIEGWLNDPEFLVDGKPVPLPVRSLDPPSFNRLSLRYAGDVNTASVLDELVRAECVSIENNIVRLVDPTYGLRLPVEDRLDITGDMVRSLLVTGEYNLLEQDPEKRRLKRYWRQRLVPKAHADALREWIRKESIATGRRIERRMQEVSHASPRENVEYVDMTINVFCHESNHDGSLQDEQQTTNCQAIVEE